MEQAMPQAKRKTTTRPAPAGPAIIDPAELPDQYGMYVQGDCMLPEIADGDVLHFDKREPVTAGDMAAIYLRPEIVPPGAMQVRVKRLVLNIPPWVTLPYRDHPDSNVVALVFAESLNPPRQFVVKCSDVLAVHKCIGSYTEEAIADPAAAPKLRRVR
jgi:hypothetical protein